MTKTVPETMLSHWPDESNVFDVVTSQAESFTISVLLAVHQPMEFLTEDPDGKVLREAGQQELLDRVLADHRDGFRIVPILGQPGVGKSHALRWLEAKIRELDKENRYHIVRVQKGASLRDVLFKVAAGLDDEGYSRFRTRIEEAQEGLSPGALLWALTGELTQELRPTSPPGWVDDDLTEAYEGWQEGLQAFLGDHIVRDRFLDNHGKGPLAALARRIHEGLKPEEVEHDSARHKFLPQDFEEALHLLGGEIASLSLPAKNFLVQLDSDGRQQCADLLNGALDPATSRLLKFRGGELHSLFVEVRQQLFREGREWVLLLEDLTALAGIRGDLFNIIVRGKDDQDEEELCTIRSVLAATRGHVDGFRGAWGTLVSRAEILFQMQELKPDLDGQVERIINLVGAYVNAARIGPKELNESFEARKQGEQWIPNYSEAHAAGKAREILADFGISADGYHLFPFNRGVIRQRILTEHLTTDGTIAYNPRSLITKLVRDTLHGMRDEFTRGEFPSSLFGTQQLSSETLILDVDRRLPDGADRQRYLRLLSYWGNQPENAGEAARLPSGVYEAFGLEALDFGEPVPELIQPPVPVGEKEDEKSSPRPSPVKASLWQTALTQWRRKESTLSQANARTIRKAVCDAVLRGLPGGWPGLPYPSDSDRRTIANKHTFIPRAGTGEAREGGAAIVICTEKDLRDEKRGAEIVLELLAVLEFHSSPDPWKATGDGGPVDFRRYAAFVRRHQDRAAKWLRENMTAIRPGDHFEHVVDGLLLSAALSNSWEGDESSLTDRMNNLLSEPTSIGSSDGEWGRLVTQAVDFGAQGRDALLKSFSAFQGTSGRTPLALDASALAPVVNAAGVGKIKRPAEGDPLQSEIVLLRKDLAEVLKNREARLIKWQGEATLFADQAFRDQLQELLTRTSSVGADVDQGGRSLAIPVRNGLHGLPEELQEIIASLDGLRSMPLTGKKIALISRISEDTLKAVEVASSAVLQYLAVAAPGAKQKLTLLESEDAQASLRELEATVDGIESALGDSTANGIDQHA